MNLETLLQVLFANNQEALIAVAVRIDNNIELDHPKTIVVDVNKNQLPAGYRPKGDSSYSIYIECPVIVINKYKLKGMYTVQLPNGQLKANCDPSTNRITELEEIPTIVNTVEA